MTRAPACCSAAWLLLEDPILAMQARQLLALAQARALALETHTTRMPLCSARVRGEQAAAPPLVVRADAPQPARPEVTPPSARG